MDDIRVVLCFGGCLALVVWLVVSGFFLRRRLAWRDVIVGPIVFLLLRMMLSQVFQAVSLQALGLSAVPLALQQTVIAVLDALAACAGYLLVFRFMYRYDRKTTSAVSVAFGAAVVEVVVSAMYPLFSYGTIFQTMADGTAADLFIQQGLSESQTATVLGQLDAAQPAAIFHLIAMGMGVVVVQEVAGALLFRSRCDAAWSQVAMGFGVIAVFGILDRVPGLLSSVISLVLLVAALIALAWWSLRPQGIMRYALDEDEF